MIERNFLALLEVVGGMTSHLDVPVACRPPGARTAAMTTSFVNAAPTFSISNGCTSTSLVNVHTCTSRQLRCPRYATLPDHGNSHHRATTPPRCSQELPPPSPPPPPPSEADAEAGTAVGAGTGTEPEMGADVMAQREASAMTAAGATLILKHAAKAYVKGGRRPSPQVLRESILQLESVQKRHGVRVDLERLLGQWRLVFITPKENPNVFNSLFFPLRAHQTIYRFPDESDAGNKGDEDSDDGRGSDVEIGEFDNGVFLLNTALYFRVIGPMRFAPKQQRLEFSVDKLKVKIGSFEWEKEGLDEDGYTLKGRTLKKLPFFTFFCVRDDIAVARGRTGGLALYARVPDGERL